MVSIDRMIRVYEGERGIGSWPNRDMIYVINQASVRMSTSVSASFKGWLCRVCKR